MTYISRERSISLIRIYNWFEWQTNRMSLTTCRRQQIENRMTTILNDWLLMACQSHVYTCTYICVCVCEKNFLPYKKENKTTITAIIKSFPIGSPRSFIDQSREEPIAYAQWALPRPSDRVDQSGSVTCDFVAIRYCGGSGRSMTSLPHPHSFGLYMNVDSDDDRSVAGFEGISYSSAPSSLSSDLWSSSWSATCSRTTNETVAYPDIRRALDETAGESTFDVRWQHSTCPCAASMPDLISTWSVLFSSAHDETRYRTDSNWRYWRSWNTWGYCRSSIECVGSALGQWTPCETTDRW